MVWIIIIILLSSADQLIKAVIRTSMLPEGGIPVIDGFFHIIFRQNTGAAWSFLADKPWGIYVLAVFSALISTAMIIYIFKTPHLKIKICLAVICGGSIGNLIDRVRDGKVSDYLDFHFGSFIFPTFNLADMLIVCGSILLCLFLLLEPALMSPRQDMPAQSGQEGPPDAG